jgi:hypothetical protein
MPETLPRAVAGMSDRARLVLAPHAANRIYAGRFRVRPHSCFQIELIIKGEGTALESDLAAAANAWSVRRMLFFRTSTPRMPMSVHFMPFRLWAVYAPSRAPF